MVCLEFFNMAADQITAGLKEGNLRPGVQERECYSSPTGR